ncbi:HAD-IA family hydrolase [Rhizobium sp.]|jgi:putative hydrolase of the HAD superfamily|uniref:HAD family hydrolase n=1 Tax=Rhizobium sp. TaxID=391 RepID=UPI000E7FE09E|nr:haloacid dehalogenase [Rhizobium sp.]
MSVLMVDVDGVLVHGRPQDGLPFGTFLERDLGVSIDQLRHEFFEKCWFDVVTGKLPMRPALEAALSRIAPDVRVETLIRYWFEHDSRLDQALISELQEQKQRGVRIYLATNQEHERAAYLMETLGLDNVASGIFYSAALGCRKPSENFYRKATEQSGVHARDIMFIDDMVENIEAARAFGWQATQWASGMSLQDVLPVDWLR